MRQSARAVKDRIPEAECSFDGTLDKPGPWPAHARIDLDLPAPSFPPVRESQSTGILMHQKTIETFFDHNKLQL